MCKISVRRMDHPQQPGVFFELSESGNVSALVGSLKGAAVVLSAVETGELGVSLQKANSEQPPAIFGSFGNEAHLTFFGQNGQPLARYPS